MSAPRVTQPENAHKNAQATRGLALYAERGHEIEHAGNAYRVPGSGSATYTADLDCGTFECRDRASILKQNLATEPVAAKRSCRRPRTADRPSRRHGEISRRPRKNTDDRRLGSDTPARDESRESLRGVLCDPNRLDRLATRKGV